MALRPCRECSRSVSSSAKTCPHCGVACPAAFSTRSVSGCRMLVAFGLVVAVAISMRISSCLRESTSPQRRPIAPSAPQVPRNPNADVSLEMYNRCKNEYEENVKKIRDYTTGEGREPPPFGPFEPYETWRRNELGY